MFTAFFGSQSSPLVAQGEGQAVMRWLFRLSSFAVVLAAGLYGGLFWFLRNPALPSDVPAPLQRAEAARLEADVRFLAGLSPSRNARNAESLDEAAAYIAAAFAETGCDLDQQPYKVDQVEYRNVVCTFGPEGAPRVVMGAHYDVAGDANPGADDNASGVAGILELARLIGAAEPSLAHRLDLVAFTLEEPPFFRSEVMGSYVYARSLRDAEVPLKLMVSVEMIGYFSDQPGSQAFPFGFLSWFYPETGNFIAVVGRAWDRSLVARSKALMSLGPALPVYSINAPAFLPGIDLSDHWSFWRHGFPAVMVTDTAFFRNPHYHRSTDRPETLDYRRMALTVDGLYRVAVGF